MPGARTHWHRHPLGQTVFVTEGIGLCQRRGGPVEIIRPGDRVLCEAGEEHGHGVIGPTRSAALAYGPRGVRINAICPGTIATPMVDAMITNGELDRARAETGQAIERLGTAEEIAQAVLRPSSDGAGCVTGIAPPVDGGCTAR
ncbi:SDR family oxidoreductase [Streptomyces xiamenensis]